MIPITEESTSGPEDYSFAEFEARFLKICEEHQASDRASVFAFVLFDIDTPELPKVFRDDEYWQALDSIAGKHMTVFTLRIRQPRRAHNIERRGMSGVGIDADPGTKVQLILRSYFGIVDAVRLPAVMFFQVDHGTVSDSSLAQLQSEGVEAVFNELRELFRDVATAVAVYKPNVAFDREVVFKAAQRTLIKRKVKHKLLKGTKSFGELVEVAKLAKMLI